MLWVECSELTIDHNQSDVQRNLENIQERKLHGKLRLGRQRLWQQETRKKPKIEGVRKHFNKKNI